MKVLFVACLAFIGFTSKAAITDTIPNQVTISRIEMHSSPASNSSATASITFCCRCGTSNQVQPLYFLDGSEIALTDVKKLNPNDISRIDVLKGEKATAIYGIKAINGVVLIETKCKVQSKQAVL